MLSPLFDIESENYFSVQGWEMTSFQREAAALGEMSDFWTDVDQEAQTLNFVLPNPDLPLEEADLDWSLSLDLEEHKEKLVHHDCMWAGSCADLIHPSNSFVPAEPAAAPPGRSLLRPPSPPRPDTPPSVDEDEPPEFRHAVDVAGTAQRLLSSVVADHSYTLVKPEPKVQYDNLGVQTPSDSEEEIDVVSVGGDKFVATPGRAEAFPRVPSAIDRHNIQNTVAYAMTPRPTAAGRKRLTPPPASTPRTKRSRAGRRARRSPTDSDSDADSPEIERRSLHNDMERMRRIGLKNLFDELKNQIPVIRDKERAPKVVILREAAAFCRHIQNEENEIDALKRQQTKLRTKLKRLRTQLAARYHQ